MRDLRTRRRAERRHSRDGVHPFGDPGIADDFPAVRVPIDARDFHLYATEWTPGRVAFFVDGELVKTVEQAPDYPMELMLTIYEFPGVSDATYPKQFVVDYVRGYRLTAAVEFGRARSSHR